jgi:hypothetical protein
VSELSREPAPNCSLTPNLFRSPLGCDPKLRERTALQLPESRRCHTAARRCLALVKFEAPEPRCFARRVGNGLVDVPDIPAFKEDVVAFRIFGVGIAIYERLDLDD